MLQGMLLEEVPDRLADVDEIAGPVMTEILNRVEDHIGSGFAIVPLLFADQNVVSDINGFWIAPVSLRPGSCPLWDPLIGNDRIRCSVNSEDRDRPWRRTL